MRMLIKAVCLAIVFLWSANAFAVVETVYISDRGGTDVGYCVDGQAVGGGNADYNYGGRTTQNVVGEGTNQAVTIYRYDLTPIPSNAQILSAAVVMECSQVGGGGDTIDLHEITDANNDWVEGTANGATQNGSYCWNYKAYDAATPTNWDASPISDSTNYKAAVIGSAAGTSTGTKTFTFNATGVQAIQDRLDDGDIEIIAVPNGGFSAGVYAAFCTSEVTAATFPGYDVTNRPYLTVTYKIGSAVIVTCE